MADIVDLRSRQPISHEDEFNSQLVQDLARFSEGLATEQEIRRRYQFGESTWAALAENEDLFSAISDAKTQRVRSGALKRELSQKLVVQAPNVLGEILCSKDANPRHRIDAARALDDFSTDKPEAAAAADRFIIQINLGDTSLTFNKSIKPDANDIDPNDTDTLSWDMSAAITAKKEDDGGGNTL